MERKAPAAVVLFLCLLGLTAGWCGSRQTCSCWASTLSRKIYHRHQQTIDSTYEQTYCSYGVVISVLLHVGDHFERSTCCGAVRVVLSHSLYLTIQQILGLTMMMLFVAMAIDISLA